jgi:hypothetical protein
MPCGQRDGFLRPYARFFRSLNRNESYMYLVIKVCHSFLDIANHRSTSVSGCYSIGGGHGYHCNSAWGNDFVLKTTSRADCISFQRLCTTSHYCARIFLSVRASVDGLHGFSYITRKIVQAVVSSQVSSCACRSGAKCGILSQRLIDWQSFIYLRETQLNYSLST